jgi:hypothetical protein
MAVYKDIFQAQPKKFLDQVSGTGGHGDMRAVADSCMPTINKEDLHNCFYKGCGFAPASLVYIETEVTSSLRCNSGKRMALEIRSSSIRE